MVSYDAPNAQVRCDCVSLVFISTQVKSDRDTQVSEEPVSITTLKVWVPRVMGARKVEPVAFRRMAPPDVVEREERRRRWLVDVDDVIEMLGTLVRRVNSMV